MASINLLPRKEFEITLNSGEVIKGKYSLWSVKRFCDRKKMKLSELDTFMTQDSITMDDVCLMILCAVEHCKREAGLAFSYTDFHVCNWIEELGGLTSEGYVSLMNHAASEIEEKKSEVAQ